MAVPYTFGSATSSIPLSQLDSNFATGITLGNTTVYLGNTTTSFGNVTLTNVTISSVSTAITPSQGGTGLVTIPANNVILGNGTSNVTVVAPGTSGNVLTSNGTTWSSSTISAASVSAAGSTTQVQYNNGGAFAGSANLTFNGTTLTAAGLSGPHNGTVGATTPSTGAFTTLSASSTVSGTGFSTYLASPPAIGGTAAAAGSFTTLSASSDLTLSGGTANGVTYLNGSKVLTSGSALTFDGVNLATNTGGTNATLGINSTSSSIYLQSRPDISYSRLISSAYQLDLTTIANQPISFGVNNSEAMRLTSTGLGIGTSSPAQKLHVGGNQILQNTGSAIANNWIRWQNSSGTYQAGIASYFNVADTGNIEFLNGSTTNMMLSSAGNLGLGVTPSAWSGTNGGAFQFGSGYSSLYSYSNAVTIGSNVYYNAGNKYFATGVGASVYQQVGGAHYWSIAASGTAGNAISFTQAMTLDASGNWMLGTTTSSGRMTAALAGGHVFNAELNGTTLGSTNGVLLSNFLNQTTRVAAINLSATSSDAGAIIFGTASGGTLAERARIDSSGNLLVGTTSQVQGTARAVFDTTGLGMVVRTSAGSAQACYIANNSATTGNNQFHWFYTDSNTFRGGIEYNRSAGLVVYNTTSDYRAKDISGPVIGSGELIDSVPVYMGKMKGATQERPMFIAHETPEYAHMGEKDAVDADGNPIYQRMDNSALIPVMWAEIQSLRQRVAQLESN